MKQQNGLGDLQALGVVIKVAIYIPIRKVFENETVAEYSYVVSGETGRLRIEKMSGEISEVSSLPFDNAEEYLARVIYKLSRHWRKGELPDATSWSA